MNEISPELPPLFESDPFAGDKEEDDETIARLLEEDVILPPNLSTRPGCAMDESPSPMPGELDLIEMCRRAAAKHYRLAIEGKKQESQGTEMDLYDGKRLPGPHFPGQAEDSSHPSMRRRDVIFLGQTLLT